MNNFTIKLTVCILTIVSIITTSCRRDQTIIEDSEADKLQAQTFSSVQKVGEWLEHQKSGTKVNKDNNLSLLKNNLDLTSFYTVPNDANSNLIVIPIKPALKAVKHLDKNMQLILVVKQTKEGSYHSGTIICFTPSDSTSAEVLTRQSLLNVYAGKTATVDGKYSFLTLTGRLRFILEFKDHRLVRHSSLSTNAPANQVNKGEIKVNANCTSWYLVVTTYYNDGSSTESWTYLGTTCSGGGCDDPEYMSFCPDDGEGGHSPVGLNTYKETITELSDESNYVDDDYNYGAESGPGGPSPSPAAPDYKPIKYIHAAELTRDGDTRQVLDVDVHNTSVDPYVNWYFDVNHNEVQRTIRLDGHFNTWVPAGIAASITWSCTVTATYVYSVRNGTTRSWGHQHRSIR